MIKNITIIVTYSVILLLSEILHRYTFDIPPLARILESFVLFVAVIGLFFFSKYRLSRIIIGLFFGLSVTLQNVHYEVYRHWVTSSNYLLMFSEITEVARAGATMLPKVIPTLIWGAVEVIIFLSISRFRKKNYVIADIIFIAFLTYMSIRSFITSNDIGLNPRTSYSKIRANTYSFTSFIGRVLPYEVFKLSDVPDYIYPKPKVLSEPKVKNIILIMGESFSAHNAHVFGYGRETTPFLSSVAQDSTIYLKPAYSAGLGTSISLPAFFNAIPYPNGLKQISLGNTSLFKLAKEQGFMTYFHSSQPEWEMEIMGLLGGSWVDKLTFPTHSGFPIYSSMNDHKLLPYFYDLNLEDGKKFIVLHQRGSHAPYAIDLVDEEKVFKSGTPLDNYDSTIYHTDLFIKKVFEHLKQRDKDDWMLIYTSDHGQYVKGNIYNQGTVDEASYLVPLFIYTPNNVLQQTIQIHLGKCERAFHQQVSTLIINTLGFDMPITSCEEGVINAHLLSGNSGYLKVKNGNVEFIYPKSNPVE